MQGRNELENLKENLVGFRKELLETQGFTDISNEMSNFLAEIEKSAQINNLNSPILNEILSNIRDTHSTFVSNMSAISKTLGVIQIPEDVNLKTLSSLYDAQKKIERQMKNALQITSTVLPEVQKKIENQIKADQGFLNKLRSFFLKKNDERLASYGGLKSAVLRLSNEYNLLLNQALNKQQKFLADLTSYENKCRTDTLPHIDILRNNIVSAENIKVGLNTFTQDSIGIITIKQALVSVMDKLESVLPEENPKYALLTFETISDFVNRGNIQNIAFLQKEIGNDDRLLAPVSNFLNVYTNLSDPKISQQLIRYDGLLNKLESFCKDKSKFTNFPIQPKQIEILISEFRSAVVVESKKKNPHYESLLPILKKILENIEAISLIADTNTQLEKSSVALRDAISSIIIPTPLEKRPVKQVVAQKSVNYEEKKEIQKQLSAVAPKNPYNILLEQLESVFNKDQSKFTEPDSIRLQLADIGRLILDFKSELQKQPLDYASLTSIFREISGNIEAIVSAGAVHNKSYTQIALRQIVTSINNCIISVAPKKQKPVGSKKGNENKGETSTGSQRPSDTNRGPTMETDINTGSLLGNFISIIGNIIRFFIRRGSPKL